MSVSLLLALRHAEGRACCERCDVIDVMRRDDIFTFMILVRKCDRLMHCILTTCYLFEQ
jgi:hypothetical protein